MNLIKDWGFVLVKELSWIGEVKKCEIPFCD